MAQRGVALVTGASGGIGFEIARVLARERYDLVLVARSAEQLEEHARAFEREHGIRALPVALDLARADAPERVVAILAEHNLTVDVLVNNAGFATYGRFAETPLEAERGEIQLNVVALTALCKLLLPPMLARRRGNILNVASTAAFVPGPYMAVYYATKAYVLSLSEALAEELRGTGVRVTALCPGATASGFQERAGITEVPFYGSRKLPDAASVAAYGVKAMHRGVALAIPGVDNRALPALLRVVPRRIVPRLVAKLQDPGGRRKGAPSM